jgi:hypothetical protein
MPIRINVHGENCSSMKIFLQKIKKLTNRLVQSAPFFLLGIKIVIKGKKAYKNKLPYH